MTLYVYADQLKSELINVVRIEIHARPVIYTRSRLNNQSMHTLTCPVGPGRTIRVYSNKPKSIFQDEQYKERPIRLLPNSNNEISVFVKFDQQQLLLTPSLVNAVDINTGELVHSWLMIVETVA